MRTRLTLEDGRTRVVETSGAVGIQPTSTGKLKRGHRRRRSWSTSTWSATPEVLLSLVASQAWARIRRRWRRALPSCSRRSFRFRICSSRPSSLRSMELTRACRRRSTRTSSSTRSTPSRLGRPAWIRPRRVTMLREFATCTTVACSRTPKTSFPLAAEIEQTERYLMFQKARFGEDAHQVMRDGRRAWVSSSVRVPSPSCVQPLVENAVGHARRDDGYARCTITITRIPREPTA